MNREDTKKFLMSMQLAYPNYKPDNKSLAVDMWNKMLEKYSYEQCAGALQEYISTDKSGFAPSLGSIIQKIEPPISFEIPTVSEAWEMVDKALREAVDRDERRRNFEMLPEIVKKSITYSLYIDLDNGTLDANNIMYMFRQSYSSEVAKLENASRKVIHEAITTNRTPQLSDTEKQDKYLTAGENQNAEPISV